MGHHHEDEHIHSGEHTHVHEHPHTHEAPAGMTPAEKVCALLGYMIDHNDHHAAELADLLPAVEGAANKKLLEAIGTFEAANVQLREVLQLLKKESE